MTPRVAEPQPLSTAFSTDIIKGNKVAWCKDWDAGALLGTASTPSPAQWQRALLKAGAFVYNGPGPLLASLPPDQLASLPLGKCAACLLFDRIETPASSRRLAKAANQKAATRLLMEEPLGTAALLSLAGVCTIMLNQWATSATEANAEAAKLLGKLGSGQSLAKALRAGREALVVHPAPAEPADPPSKPGSKTATPGPAAGGKRATSPTRPGSKAARGTSPPKRDASPTPKRKSASPPRAPSPPAKPSTPGTKVGRLDLAAARAEEKAQAPWGPVANAIVFGLPTFGVKG